MPDHPLYRLNEDGSLTQIECEGCNEMREALTFIAQRGYTGASWIAQRVLAGENWQTPPSGEKRS